MIFDPSDPVIDESLFNRKYWTASEFGFSLEELLPVEFGRVDICLDLQGRLDLNV